MTQLLERSLGIETLVSLAGQEPNRTALLNGEIDPSADSLGTVQA